MMARLYSTRFLGFLKLRIGVFMLSMMSLAGAILVAVPAWLQTTSLPAHPLNSMDTAGLFVHIILFTTIAATSFIGLVGSLLRMRRVMIAYWIILATLLVAAIAGGAFTLASIFTPNTPEEIKACQHGAQDDVTKVFCENGVAVQKPVAIVIYLAAWLILAFSFQTAYSYAVELNKIALGQPIPSDSITTRDIGNPTVLAAYSSNFVESGPTQNPGYIFSSNRNSFGRPAPRPLPEGEATYDVVERYQRQSTGT